MENFENTPQMPPAATELINRMDGLEFLSTDDIEEIAEMIALLRDLQKDEANHLDTDPGIRIALTRLLDIQETKQQRKVA